MLTGLGIVVPAKAGRLHRVVKGQKKMTAGWERAKTQERQALDCCRLWPPPNTIALLYNEPTGSYLPS